MEDRSKRVLLFGLVVVGEGEVTGLDRLREHVVLAGRPLEADEHPVVAF